MIICCSPGYNASKSQSRICNRNLLSRLAPSSSSYELGGVFILSPLGWLDQSLHKGFTSAGWCGAADCRDASSRTLHPVEWEHLRDQYHSQPWRSRLVFSEGRPVEHHYISSYWLLAWDKKRSWEGASYKLFRQLDIAAMYSTSFSLFLFCCFPTNTSLLKVGNKNPGL